MTRLVGREVIWKEETWRVEKEGGEDLRIRGTSGEIVTVSREMVEILPNEAELAQEKIREEIGKLETRLRGVQKNQKMFEFDLAQLQPEISRLEKIISQHKTTASGLEKEILVLKKTIEMRETQK